MSERENTVTTEQQMRESTISNRGVMAECMEMTPDSLSRVSDLHRLRSGRTNTTVIKLTAQSQTLRSSTFGVGTKGSKRQLHASSRTSQFSSRDAVLLDKFTWTSIAYDRF